MHVFQYVHTTASFTHVCWLEHEQTTLSTPGCWYDVPVHMSVLNTRFYNEY